MSWRIRVLGLARPHDWAVTGLPASASAQDAEVRRLLGCDAVTRVATHGSCITYVARPGTRRGPVEGAAGPEVGVLTSDGPDAGRLAPLTGGGLTVGRGGSRLVLDDPLVPSEPTRILLEADGVRVDRPGVGHPSRWTTEKRLRVGGTALSLMRGSSAPLPAPDALTTAQVELGQAPAEHSAVLPVVMAVGPLAIGAVLAVTMRTWLFLLFGLVSVLGVGVMLGLQRAARRRHSALLAERAAEVVARRRVQELTPATVSRAVRSRAADRFGLLPTRTDAPAPLLWWGEGTGALPFTRDEETGRWNACVDVAQPAVTSCPGGSVVAVSGGSRVLQAAGRWALFQLLRHAVATGTRLRVASGELVETWWDPAEPEVETLLELADAPWLAAALRVWRSTAGLSDLRPPADTTGRTPSAVVRMGARGTGAPGARSADALDLDARVLHSPSQRVELRDLHATGISPSTLHWWLQELADDVARLGLGPGGADTPPLRVPGTVGRASAARHARAHLTPDTPAGGRGIALDLADDGPHVLIAGTTGSGKSDLLLSLLVGLAAHHAPAELSFVLLDFKGGASFGPLAGLPHTMSLETNHVGAASLRALDAISAELRRREALFAAAGVPDYPAFRAARTGETLPRLVVAVDELRVLVDEHPAANAVLQRLAATGRSLGFHLMLATQRATGAVSSDVRSNLGSTLALRTASEQESWDLIGVGDAAQIDPAAPGTVCLTRGGHPLLTVRAAPWACSDSSPVWRRWTDPAPAHSTGTDWPGVVGELVAAYRGVDPPIPAPVVSPPLPAVFAPDRSRRRDADVLALIDDAARARHVPWRWPAGSEGSAAWIIEPAGGRGPVLTAVLDIAARGPGPVVVLDGSGEAAAALTGVDPESTLRVLRPEAGDEDLGASVIVALEETSQSGGTLVITGWSAWTGVRVGDTYRSLDEDVHRLLGGAAARSLRVAAVGGRDLASARLLLHLPHRFFVPAGTSPEHRLVWPRLIEVEPVPGRAVHVHPDGPEQGMPAQLAVATA